MKVVLNTIPPPLNFELLCNGSHLSLSTVDRGVETKTITLSMQHEVVRAKTGWHGNRIMYQSGVTCLPAECCFSELAIY